MLFPRFAALLSLSALSRLGYALTYRGADFSSLVLLENSGIKYHDAATSSSAAKFEAILAKHGANLARIRIWTSSDNEDYSLHYGLALAKRAVAAGMSLLIDLHFSDTWADPGHQAIPAAWPTTLAGLNTQIFTYTHGLVAAFSAQGTPIQFLQIGNEINDGILWPIGQISVNGYSPLSQLLHSAVNGARTASSTVRTVIHLANGWDAEGVSSFYNQIFIPGEFAIQDVDVMGFSFYPFYGTGATLSVLQVVSLSFPRFSEYGTGQDAMVVETDWPVVCSGVALSEPAIPISSAGQQAWILDIRNVLSALSGGHGIGIAYWEPGWVGSAALGSSCADNLLVNGNGTTRASIVMFSADM
ncbi:arabinogalactan endo-1,4-beta-galactosidase [Mycena filopes]|nr:arabinogalactan endo-1,4-beta-galactosidase [Mycena filopes]